MYVYNINYYIISEANIELYSEILSEIFRLEKISDDSENNNKVFTEMQAVFYPRPPIKRNCLIITNMRRMIPQIEWIAIESTALDLSSRHTHFNKLPYLAEILSN